MTVVPLTSVFEELQLTVASAEVVLSSLKNGDGDNALM